MTDTPDPSAEIPVGTLQRIGGAVMACPECGAEIRTEAALRTEQIPNGLRFVGVPCGACGKTFTVELTEGSEEKPNV